MEESFSTGAGLSPAAIGKDRSALGVTHGHQAVAHVGVGSAVVLRRRRLVKNEPDDAPEPRLRAALERRQLFHQVVEVVGGQFVEDGLDLPQGILGRQLLFCGLAAARRLHPDAVELRAGARGKARRTFSCLKPGRGLEYAQTGRAGNFETIKSEHSARFLETQNHIYRCRSEK